MATSPTSATSSEDVQITHELSGISLDAIYDLDIMNRELLVVCWLPALANGPIADRISRRWSILLANVVFLIGSVIQTAAFTIP
ncbi:hypothetical protein GGR58DRAFT_505763 [Xylaria digitata]|nr:hypothetical protein GGR58DRAFT_505763 [Xylaria digitata]